MDAFITGLCGSLGSNAFWLCFKSIIPILAISLLFGLGKYLIDLVIFNITRPDRKFSDEELKDITSRKGKLYDL